MFVENTEGAFSAYRFFEAIGFVLGYVYNKFICVDTKTYILMALHVIGSALYYLTEYVNKKQERKKPVSVEMPEWTKEKELSTLHINDMVSNV